MFGEGLISTLGEQHRKQRKKLNPVFSTSNMRELLPIIQTVSHQLKSVLVANFSDPTSVEFDVLPWFSRSAVDCICEGIPGYYLNAVDNEYIEALDAVVRKTLRPYLSLPVLSRRTTEATSLPLQFPVRSASGEEIGAVSVAENHTFVISILATNYNKAVCGKDASDWKPERWLKASQ
ncbi:hypothetical protein AZE42_11571, partial [Rhizopogon vesiculosus]